MNYRLTYADGSLSPWHTATDWVEAETIRVMAADCAAGKTHSEAHRQWLPSPGHSVTVSRRTITAIEIIDPGA